ncbi:MAG: hypothetical protein NTZ35_03545 [Ignavibacteriales bacterium]|nr:hypothetical protein [Ignavibacteriales bacterium]
MLKMPFFVLLALSICATVVFAQLPDETSGRVPELDAFHKPIYALWHEAWPAKDIAKLKALLPDVEKAYTTLAAAKLPGILREKKAKWDEKLQLLTQAVKDYRKGVDENNSDGILKAAEAVHMNYEQMVRVVRPVMAEIDAFHQSLYLLHHYYVPEQKMDQIKASADSLMKKMVALNAAELPKRLEAKKEQFAKARKNLDEAVKAFAEGMNAKRAKDDIAKLESTLHTRYEVLEKVFE